VVRVLGGNLAEEEAPQILVPGGVWQGSRLLPGPYGYGLVGCTMAPGFDYGDYVRGGRDELLVGWPDQTERITRLTPHG
jgi:predicted cupin superfamily sugar epimerase